MSWDKLRLPVAIAVVALLGFLLWRSTREEGRRGTGDDRARRGAAEAAITADDVPVLAWGPDADRTRASRERDLFEYAKSPEEIAAEEAAREAARRKAELERERLKAERERQAELARRRAAEEAERRRREALAALNQPTEPPPPSEPPPPEPPTFEYTYVGIIGPHADPYAILQDDEDDFRYVKAGDVVDEAFLVQRVGRLKMDLSYTDPTFEGDVTEVPRTFVADSLDGAAPRGRSLPQGRRPRS